MFYCISCRTGISLSYDIFSDSGILLTYYSVAFAYNSTGSIFATPQPPLMYLHESTSKSLIGLSVHNAGNLGRPRFRVSVPAHLLAKLYFIRFVS